MATLLEDRELGRIIGDEPGATLVAVAGIHGNEPAGIHAAQRVLRRLGERPGSVRGELVVLAGNFAALRRGVRYQRADLNRAWTRECVDAVRAMAAHAEEELEQLELLAAIEATEQRSRGARLLVDLHTSSAPGIPFLMVHDDDPHRAFVASLGIPALLGLDAHIRGVLSQYMSSRGWISFAVEGGQHTAPDAVDALEAVLWKSLHGANLLADDGFAPEVRRSGELLDGCRGELPRMLEVCGRHAIVPEDRFVMEAGFRNIHRAGKGQLLARDARGEIRATEDGLVILPLYQGLGSDGFFWGRALSTDKPRGSVVATTLCNGESPGGPKLR